MKRSTLEAIEELVGPVEGIVSTDVLADWLGLTNRRVTELANVGVIPRVGRNQFVLKAAVRAYALELRTRASGRGRKDGQLEEERRRLVAAQAEREELRVAHQRGELVRAADVASTWAQIIVDVRQALLAVPARLPVAARPAVDAEIRRALEALADQ